MLSFSRVLIGCAVALLSVSAPVVATSGSTQLELSGNLAGQSLNVEVFSGPGNSLYVGPQQTVGPLGAYFTFATSSATDNRAASLIVQQNGALSLTFPAGSDTLVFDGDELLFSAASSPAGTVPFFVTNSQFYDNVAPTVSSVGYFTPSSTIAKNSLCVVGTGIPVGSCDCSKITYQKPVVSVDPTSGAIKFNILAAPSSGASVFNTGSISTVCSVTYAWVDAQGDYLKPCVAGEKDSGCINGDPQFTGFVGQSYQVHGVSGSVYNVLSTPRFQLNALFTYLESGKCRTGTMCFSHPGNYFGEVGMVFMGQDGEVSRLRVVAGSVNVGMQLFLNDHALSVSADRVQVGESYVVFGDAFSVTVNTPEFALRLVNSDMFLNEDIGVDNALLRKIQEYKQAVKRNDTSADVQLLALPHGLLGQTWEYKTYPNRWKYIQGQLFDYVLADGIFGSNFAYNRFAQ